MVSGETALLAAGGGLAVAEATGVTNVVPGFGRGGQRGGSGGGSPTSLPAALLSALQTTGSGLPDGLLTAISNAGVGSETLQAIAEGTVSTDLAERIAEQSGGFDPSTVENLLQQQADSFETVVETTSTAEVPTADDVADEVPTADDVADEVTSRLGPEAFGLDQLGNATGGDGGGGQDTNFGGEYDLARFGFADPIRATAEVGKEGAQGAGMVDSFLQENPYVAAGTGIGAISPDPVTTGLGFAAGSLAEVTADTLTGNTPLGVRSPVDVTEQYWWQGSAPLEGTSAVQDAQDAIQQFAGTTAVPTAAAAAGVSSASDVARRTGALLRGLTNNGTTSAADATGSSEPATGTGARGFAASAGVDTDAYFNEETSGGSDDGGSGAESTFDPTDANQNLLKQASFGSKDYSQTDPEPTSVETTTAGGRLALTMDEVKDREVVPTSTTASGSLLDAPGVL